MKKLATATLAFALFLPLFAADSAPGPADWAAFRAGGGMVDEAWNPGALKGAAPLWKVKVGRGYSSLTVAGDRLFTAGLAAGEKDTVLCLDAGTGRTVWSFQVAGKSIDYPGTRGTPVIDGGKVYYFGLKGVLYCLDAATGKELWENAVAKEARATENSWGFASSVRIDGALALVNIGATGAAVGKAGGKTAWKTAGGVSGYATPVPFDWNGRRYAAFFSQRSLSVVDLATGKEFAATTWETDCLVNAADPLFFDGDKLFISTGYGRGCAAFQLGDKGLKKLWENKSMAAHFTSPIYYGGGIIGVNGNAGYGELVCLDAKTGRQVWAGGTGFGGFLAAGGLIALAEESGGLVVCKLDAKKYAEVGRYDGLAERIVWTAPVIAGGRLYIRSDNGSIVCYGVGK